MISDVLSEAVDEIKRYAADPVFAQCYDPSETEIVLAVMATFRVMLDLPPEDPRAGELRRALCSLNIVPLREALRDVDQEVT